GNMCNPARPRPITYAPNNTPPAGGGAGAHAVAAMAAGAARGRATPSTPGWGRVEADNPIKDFMTKVLTGADPAEEARRASRRITDALSFDGR
ncbi:sugar transporter, partial [Streptomyces sp. NPDC059515]